MKNKSKGYEPKKSKVFKLQEITEFLETSDDVPYLAHKVILIFGVCGALRSQEICNITVNDVEDTGTQFIIEVKNTKNYYPRRFIIGKEFYAIVKKYMQLRPDGMDTTRFFVNFDKGKCTRQVIGKHKIGSIPSTIASYLNLEDLALYTGHCYRRTAATILSNAGGNIEALKKLGGWRNSNIAGGYVQNSLQSKNQNYNLMFKNVNLPSSTSTHRPLSPTVVDTADNVPKSVVNVTDIPLLPSSSLLKKPPCLNLPSEPINVTHNPTNLDRNSTLESASTHREKQPPTKKPRIIRDQKFNQLSTSKNVYFENCQITRVTIINHYSKSDS